jgi:hypothetical protein
MQINKIDNSSFKSRLIPNKYLASAFDNAEASNNREFLNSVKTILKDGKDDTVELFKSSNSNLNLLVNGEITEEVLCKNYYENPAILAITKYAKKIFGSDMLSNTYNDLSKKELDLIKDDAYMIKLFSENLSNRRNYIEDVQNRLKNIKQIINDNTKKELEDLRKTIFGK